VDSKILKDHFPESSSKQQTSVESSNNDESKLSKKKNNNLLSKVRIRQGNRDSPQRRFVSHGGFTTVYEDDGFGGEKKKVVESMSILHVNFAMKPAEPIARKPEINAYDTDADFNESQSDENIDELRKQVEELEQTNA